MERRKPHCKAITIMPQSAQTVPTTVLKIDALTQIIDSLLLASRQSAWKVFFPLDYEGDGTDTTTPTDPTIPTF